MSVHLVWNEPYAPWPPDFGLNIILKSPALLLLFDDVSGLKCYLVTYLSHGEIKLNLLPLNLNIFAVFPLESCGFFTIVYFGIPKDDKIVYNNFFEKLNFYFLCKVKILSFPCKVVVNNYHFYTC